MVEALEALGKKDEAQDAKWRYFEKTLSVDSLRAACRILKISRRSERWAQSTRLSIRGVGGVDPVARSLRSCQWTKRAFFTLFSLH
jgi:hypothetical protein